MHLPPASLLNKVAEKVSLKSKPMDLLFRMKQAELDRFLERQAKALTASGHDPIVAQAYQMLYPLLAENEAISKFVEMTGDSSLRGVFPEIVSKRELVRIADRELMLTHKQKEALYSLLR